jgi:hypothetical protein
MIAMMIMEHLLLGFKVVMMYLIDDVPRWIREAIAKKNALERQASAKARMHKYVQGAEAWTEPTKPHHSGAASHRMSISAPFRRLSHATSTAWYPQALPPSGQPSPKADADDASISTLAPTDINNEDRPHRKRGSSILSMFSLKSAHTPRGSAPHGGHHRRVSSGSTSPTPPEPAIPQETDASPRSSRRPSRGDSGTSDLRATSSMYDLNKTDFVDVAAAANAHSQEHDHEGDDHAHEAAESPVDRLVRTTASPFGFDPAHMMILICLPAALHYFQITPWLYIPCAVLFFGYLQTKKDRVDRKIAMGIVSDPTLLKLILEEMPNWPTDSEFQQMVSTVFVKM